jgi:hypothetical protein
MAESDIKIFCLECKFLCIVVQTGIPNPGYIPGQAWNDAKTKYLLKNK